MPTTLDDIIGWNAYMEMTGYWWPTVASQYVNDAPTGNRKSHCSAFIATGSATADGRIVIGHESFTEFWNGQFMNVILDITPTDGLPHGDADQSRLDRQHDRLLGDRRRHGRGRDDDGRLRGVRHEQGAGVRARPQRLPVRHLASTSG